jgi:hypothetical protein
MKKWLGALLSVVAVGACARTADRESVAPAACGAGGAKRPSAGMPVLGIHHAPSLTRGRYEAVVGRLTNGQDRLRSVSEGNIEGLLVHVAGEGDDGFWVIDVWASQEAADRFARGVRPIAQAVGIEQPMRTYALHTFLIC